MRAEVDVRLDQIRSDVIQILPRGDLGDKISPILVSVLRRLAIEILLPSIWDYDLCSSNVLTHEESK